jgi:glycerol kinase
VLLCWLALLLIRVIETRTEDSWVRIRDERRRRARAGRAAACPRNRSRWVDPSAGRERLKRHRVPDSGGVYVVPAFTGLGAPHWDPFAGGTIVGLTRATTAAHIARATLEATAFQSADVVRAMEADSGITLSELRVDGGAAVNDAPMQFQCDLLGVPVLLPQVAETTALGAAYLAGLAVGFWKDPEELAAQWKVDRGFEPAMTRDHAEELRSNWTRAVERAKEWANPAT